MKLTAEARELIDLLTDDVDIPADVRADLMRDLSSEELARIENLAARKASLARARAAVRKVREVIGDPAQE